MSPSRPASRPNSRPASRSNSISEAPINIPIDSRIQASHRTHFEREQTLHEKAAHWLKRDGKDGSEHHAHHHHDQDPKLFGPGFSTAAPHTAAGAQVRYVLVTPEMMAAIESGSAPQTTLVHPEGTDLKSSAAVRYRSHAHSHVHTPALSRVQTPAPGLDVAPQTSLETGDMSKSMAVSSPGFDKGEKGHMNELARGSGDSCDSITLSETYPNPWMRIRHSYKEYFAEFFGTALLIIFGNGVNCQVVLSGLTQGSYLSISHGWGIGVLAGVYAAGGISGGHINPAVTISLATFRGFPWRKVPGYALAQTLGAMFASCLIQGNYHALLNKFEGGYNVRTFSGPNATATLFFTGPQAYMSNIGAFCSEVLATSVLLFLILALGDANNNPAPAGMNGVILYLIIMGIGATLGTETAYCLNPARDLGPRIAAAMYGYPSEIWTDRHCYWIYVPIVATILGGLIGCFFYDFFLFAGPESPINQRWRLPWTKKNDEAAQTVQA